ncbi:Signal recognition particle protein [Candidatus Rhabdochlamydia oedothoracis]|uniref:signal-recognition-particle GTPase n=1 Tax=Candidatus Rhabdochlamydia oedothoracis TaxID=2720720 RepID=A0ABX8V0Y9_9BACT|nr:MULTISPECIES: signal recognition particle protein [Rhabdochlamydia]KAG6559371.1 Signal recognition particle protein [Candidatus Rhabdochlamydia sp. W815]MCL6756348.1 signal recognition particle protein [Candidatus Rhabdochlamydia oedothoracis]QYF48526.1 Signal recognition particle protein [Candidatus Rhabdochlamydia oedothoracis]
MFDSLTQKFQGIIASLKGKKTLTEDNITDAVRQVRMALLDADVNYSVAGSLVKKIQEKALGKDVLKALSASEQFIKLVHDELVLFMGQQENPLALQEKPTVIMLCGLQGSGKTTQCAKLAYYLRKKHPNKKVLLAACDLQRPAAVEQLKKLATEIEVPVVVLNQEMNPIEVAKAAKEKAVLEGFDVLIIDTAGRLHIDEELMQQLIEIKQVVKPQEILFVANAATGQDAVKTALEFDKHVQITGTILTMLDGSSRAGAAISIQEVTKKPLKFEGIGEKVSDLQLFNPHSMADRILGMGDVINLVRKAEEITSKEEVKTLEKKMLKGSFTYDDLLKQMKLLNSMGPLKGLLKMLPGGAELANMDFDEKEFVRRSAIISSMTKKERLEKVELVPSRRRRIADGSGNSIDEVNRMIKEHKRLKHIFKDMPSLKQKMAKNKIPSSFKGWKF